MQIEGISRPRVGERVCGDHYEVIPWGEEILIAVADGLGHGPEAAQAAQAACLFVKENAGEKLESLMLKCNRAITHTRGVALTIIRINPEVHSLAYIGVGNVEMQSLSQEPIRPINIPGIVGSKIRRVQETRHVLTPGDLLAVFTDGISNRFQLEKYRRQELKTIARTILEEHGKAHDDATCVIVAY